MSTRRHALPPVLALILAAAASARADDGPKGNISVRFLSEVSTIPLMMETDPFVEWVKPVIAAVESRFPKEKTRKLIVVQVAFHHDRPAEIELAGNPKLSDEDVRAIRAVADPMKAPRTKVAICSFRIVARDKEGNPDELPGLTPALRGPYERLLDRVKTAPTREGLALIRRWAMEESLPLLAASAIGAEEKYQGVRGLGRDLAKALSAAKSPPSVAALATKNPNFWRATMEMEPGNPLAPAVETSLLIAAGRVEWAQQVAALAGFFDAGKSGSSALLRFGKALSEGYLKGLNDRIGRGIALHDGGRLDEALAAFDAILKDDPHSAWALYERFHTDRSIKLKAIKVPAASNAWPETRARILASHPLYRSMGEAHGKEGIFDLTRRAAIGGLFKNPQASVKDVLAYADIALDLEAYDMAAMLYWSIVSRLEPAAYGDRPLLENFFFALERLGVTGLKDAFKGDHAAAFAAIEADRRARVEQPIKPAKPDSSEVEPRPGTARP